MKLRKLGIAVVLLFFSFISSVFAHGTLETPISRLYNCRLEGPESPKSAACKAAVAVGGKQALYDWNSLNQGSANGNHQGLIQDGHLCSASRDQYKGMDLPTTASWDWVTTNISPNADGKFDFIFYATAPHATRYFKLYMTRDGYDFTKPLTWADVEEPFCTITSVTLQNGRYKLTCPLPNKNGRRIVFLIWQRSDSAEAFYACSDVNVSGTNPNPGPTPPPATAWKELSSLNIDHDVTLNTKIVFRLFKNGADAESYSIIAAASQLQKDQWPYYLAQEVNAKSSLVNIGQLDTSTNKVTPAMSATLNKVYIKDTNLIPYNTAIDLLPPSDQYDYIYPDNIANYKAGTIVLVRDPLNQGNDKRYRCKPWPASGWCTQTPYSPGKGIYWQNAWDLIS